MIDNDVYELIKFLCKIEEVNYKSSFFSIDVINNIQLRPLAFLQEQNACLNVNVLFLNL